MQTWTVASTPSTASRPGSAKAKAPRTPLIEVFASLQGEGRHTGRPTVFVRTATCPIRCRYCDTPGSYAAPRAFPVEGADSEPNPVSSPRLLELVALVAKGALGDQPGAPAMVSFTGGEPLVHARAVAWCGTRLRGAGRPVALESAALDPDALATALPGIDHLSADWKLPSTLEGGADHAEAHTQCIRRALDADRTVDVKLVITPAVPDEEFDGFLERALELQAFRADRAPEWVLQPVTPFGRVTEGVSPERLAALVGRAVASGLPVRVQHQMHKVWRLP